MIYKTVFTLIVISSLLTACHSQGVRDIIVADDSNNLADQKNMLLNQSLSGINTILGDSINLKSKFIFLYNGSDCETCLKKGFYLINLLDSIAKSQVVYIITSSPSIGTDQIRYGYKDYVYYDEHDLIRRKLKYIFTPVFLFLDSSNRIQYVLYPSYKMGLKEENDFIYGHL